MDTGGSVRSTGGIPHERDGGAVGTCTEHGHGCFALRQRPRRGSGSQSGYNCAGYADVGSRWLSVALATTRYAEVGMDMYLDFYRLTSAPFPLTPDPTLLFVSPRHQAALDALTQGIAARQGLVVITGASGVGKTMVHAYLTRVAAPQLTTIVLWHARLSFMDILGLMARRFDMPVAPDDLGALRTQMQQCLRHEAHGP